MSYYRVYEYPNSCVPYKHVYMKRDRYFPSISDDKASENAAEILAVLAEQDKEKGRFAESLSRTKRTVTDLILCNQFEYFCTFTFDPKKVDRYDYSSCQKKLRKFFNHFKERYAPDFKYLIIPEFHKDGAIHFHGVCSGFPDGELYIPQFIYKRVGEQLISVKNHRLYMAWDRYQKSFGFFNCSSIRNYNACAFYITKYITKDLFNAGKGKRLIMCSLGLNRPQLVYDEDDIPVIFRPEYENDYCVVGFEHGEVLDEIAGFQSWLYGDVFEWEELEFFANDDIPLEQLSLFGGSYDI